MFMGARAKGFAGALIFIALASWWLASRDRSSEILQHHRVGTTALWIALGPLTGWITAIRLGSIIKALWSLVPATLFSVGPLILWIRGRAWPWLVVASVVWLASGYFFAVAIWV